MTEIFPADSAFSSFDIQIHSGSSWSDISEQNFMSTRTYPTMYVTLFEASIQIALKRIKTSI